jgi:hypothetical protein
MQTPDHRPQFDLNARRAFVAAFCLLLIAGVSFQVAVRALNVYLQKKPVELRGGFSTIPRTLGRWKAYGDDRVLDAAMVEELGTSKYLDRVYIRDGERQTGSLAVHLAYYTGMIDAVPHVPDRCMVAAGFNAKTLPENCPLPLDTSAWTPDPEYVNLATGQPYPLVTIKNDFLLKPLNVRMPVGNMRLRVVEFERADRPDWKVYGGYFFIANGRVTPAPDGVRAMAFNLREKYAYYCKLQFVYGAPDATQDAFLRYVAELLQELLPELMQRLPDWAQIERARDR